MTPLQSQPPPQPTFHPIGNDPAANVPSAIMAGMGMITPQAREMAGNMLDNPHRDHILVGHSEGGMSARLATTSRAFATVEAERRPEFQRAPSPGDEMGTGFGGLARQAGAFYGQVGQNQREHAERYSDLSRRATVMTYGAPSTRSEAGNLRQTVRENDWVAKIPTTNKYRGGFAEGSTVMPPVQNPGMVGGHKWDTAYGVQAQHDVQGALGSRPGAMVQVAGGVNSHGGRDAAAWAAGFQSQYQPPPQQQQPPPYQPPQRRSSVAYPAPQPMEARCPVCQHRMEMRLGRWYCRTCHQFR
jgi:hypothetical protein